jgi:hypothetical protein
VEPRAGLFQEDFHGSDQLLEGLGVKKIVAYVGNFRPEFSTESYIRRAFIQLGWDVLPLQEDTVTLNDIYAAANVSDFLAVTHTHSWRTEWESSSVGMRGVLERLAGDKIPTIALHQDRYWGIPEREEMLRHHWFFRCFQVWTSDGGNQDKFASLGIEHHWFPPGIDARHVFKALPESRYQADVCFVGSRNYHDTIYPFRKQMVDWLDNANHPWSFMRFGDGPGHPTVRGPELNSIYASVKVVVGDSIFAGSKAYYSDRIPETCGRNGFLIHPASEGMEFPLACYQPQSIESLDATIRYWLEHDKDREELREAGFEWWRRNGTWAHRVAMVLNHLGFPTEIYTHI